MLRILFVLLAVIITLSADAMPRGSYSTNIGCTTNGSDGFSGAPVATIQFPTLFSGNAAYTSPPTFCVPGVGYAVGIPSATVLADPVPSGNTPAAGLTAVGCTYPNPPNHVLQCSTASQTIQGWDFSLHGGWTVLLAATNLTLQNNNFVVGANARPPIFLDNSITSGTTTIKNNFIDGAKLSPNPAGGMIQGSGGGTSCGNVVIEYNFITNYYDQAIQIGACSSFTTTNVTINFNVFYRGGYGSPSGAHGDMIQLVSSTVGAPVVTAFDASYNLLLFDDPATNWSSQGFSIPNSGGNTLRVLGETIIGNVFLLPQTYLTTGGVCPCRNINDAVLIDQSWMSGTATVNNNYVDPNGIGPGGWYTNGGNPGGGGFSGSVSGSGNKNIRTGAACTVGGTASCPP